MKAMYRPLMQLSTLPLLLALGLMSVADDAIGLGVANVNGNPGTGGTLRSACDPTSDGEGCAETDEDAQAAGDASADAPTSDEAASEDELAENPAAEAEESSVDSSEDSSEDVADDSSDDSTDESGTE